VIPYSVEALFYSTDAGMINCYNLTDYTSDHNSICVNDYIYSLVEDATLTVDDFELESNLKANIRIIQDEIM
jgi:hypothetical protein